MNDPGLAALSETLFASFSRRDQRLRGRQYLAGLLMAEGRKTVRNIAASLGDPALEQRLHHFISSSTWDWRPVRRTLATLLSQAGPARAWVVRPMPIPKTGEHSVGVAEAYDPHLARVFRGQQAFGVWHASQDWSAPVGWRLFLPTPWAHDHVKLRRARVPEGVRAETVDGCAVSAATHSALGWMSTRSPVVVDYCLSEVAATVRAFGAVGAPVVARVGPTTRFLVGDPSLPGFGAGALDAGRILESVTGLRRPLEWSPPQAGALPRSSLVAAVRVAFPGARDDPGALLFGEWNDPHRPPRNLWVVDTPTTPARTLLHLTKLPDQVATDLSEVGAGVGLKDYEGRSFQGWHRHITLASAAHAFTVLRRAHQPVSPE
ncbi:transposase [Streptomyces sp. B-S-A8]|uniref:Transposase n=1 Tax=Streptomyces solicavernae TaxID=3043614 RepID=A0ABT6RY72_9ACTN|nr:transposase [Streptomyces sp. B-S-A8]MDI3389353.1 transposase [Streptomyces sp. B-S-A8]